jgi:hypothetical protein
MAVPLRARRRDPVFFFHRIALPVAQAALNAETRVLRTFSLCRPGACIERSDNFCAGIGEAELCIQKCLLWLRHPPTHGYVLHAGGKLGCARSRKLVAAQAPIMGIKIVHRDLKKMIRPYDRLGVFNVAKLVS